MFKYNSWRSWSRGSKRLVNKNSLDQSTPVILLQIVMVSPGTHPAENHESQSRIIESQFKNMTESLGLGSHTVNLKTGSKTLYYSFLKIEIYLLLSNTTKTKRNMCRSTDSLKNSHRNHTDGIFYKNIFSTINRFLRPTGRIP